MAIDVGTGGGRAVLAAAARDPRTLVIGIDASAAAMAESSRRAAGPVRRGGRSNAAFILAAAEAIPSELHRIADRVTVHFPWASLLRGCLGQDARVARGIASIVCVGGTLELLLAPAARDGLAGLPVEPHEVVSAATSTFERLGFAATSARPATDGEVDASGSTWAKRLRSQQPTDRPVMLVRLVRAT